MTLWVSSVTSRKIRRTVVVFPVPGGTAEDGGESAPALEGRLDEEGEFLELGVAVVEVVGDERELEDVRISEEGLVAAEKRQMRHRRIWRGGSR